MTFDEIANLLPGGLPPSAYRHGAWWNNEDDPGSTHSQSRLFKRFDASLRADPGRDRTGDRSHIRQANRC